MSVHKAGDMRTLDHVLAIVVHKFGNSLNSHNMTLEVLLRNFDVFEDPKKIHYLRRALEQTKRQQRLLSALKSYSGLNVGTVREVPFIIFWQQFRMAMTNRLDNTQVRFDAWQDIESIPVFMEIQALSQALQLLVDNAMDAVADMEVPHISLSASCLEEDEEHVRIQVRDNGPGIAEQYMGSIFTPLFSTRQEQFGLGLPLARKIITRLGGTLAVSSDKTGTTAEIRLRRGHAPDKGQEWT